MANTNFDRITAIMAILVSVFAMGISVFQGERQKNFNRETLVLSQKSLSPLLRIDFNAFIEGKNGIRVSNVGFGPALIDSIEVIYRDTLLQASSGKVLKELARRMRSSGATYSKGCYFLMWTYSDNLIISKDEDVDLLSINKNCPDNSFIVRCHNTLDTVQIRITYQSLFEEDFETVQSYP